VEQFKMDCKFDTVQKNREDKELISFAQMDSMSKYGIYPMKIRYWILVYPQQLN
jgi:hypothetical protein